MLITVAACSPHAAIWQKIVALQPTWGENQVMFYSSNSADRGSNQVKFDSGNPADSGKGPREFDSDNFPAMPKDGSALFQLGGQGWSGWAIQGSSLPTEWFWSI